MTRLESRPNGLPRHTAPPFVMLSGLELLQLRKLSWLARALFLELVALARFDTGAGVTSYAALLSLLDFDADPHARGLSRPTLQAVRTALQALVDLQLVRIKRSRNEQDRRLFFRVTSRMRMSAPDDLSNRVSNRPTPPVEQGNSRLSERSTMFEQQTEQQPLQEGIYHSVGSQNAQVIHMHNSETARHMLKALADKLRARNPEK